MKKTSTLDSWSANLASVAVPRVAQGDVPFGSPTKRAGLTRGDGEMPLPASSAFSIAAFNESQREPVDRLLKMKEVVLLTGMCRSSVYNRMREGEFVPSVQVGPRSIRFPESEVRSWIAERLLRRDAKEGRHARP